jgi:hypothetical protein
LRHPRTYRSLIASNASDRCGRGTRALYLFCRAALSSRQTRSARAAVPRGGSRTRI